MSDMAFHPKATDTTLLRILQALADPVRLTTVRSLGLKDGVSCSVVQADAGLTIGKSTMSHHLKILREAGIISISLEGSRRLLHLRRADLDGRFPGLLDAVLTPPEGVVGTE
ncbi:helix-turn-helix domain-containing protein [Streptomyces olivoreticuli]|uniref:ArsR/SmtB family transcription factor n=1 Tax=Streptomyces olivoreticuli TaxID=68246 RepID=UPI00265885DC|nr:helix-turn-helix domain-containing protein [Streptomyces olivoreticuli]WKK27091.1 helix-turn-helix domain-containing protein [Streptomyces olivoreticuli]